MKEQWRDLAEERNVFNTASLICFLAFQLTQADKTFTVNGRKHIHFITGNMYNTQLSFSVISIDWTSTEAATGDVL